MVAVTTLPVSKGTIDNFGDRLRSQVAAAMVRYENGFRACAMDPVGCDRGFLDDVALPDPKARVVAGFDKRIVDKIRRRPNPNPDLDYMVVETVEFPTDFDHAEAKVCYVDGAAKVFIGDKPEDLIILNDQVGGSRGIASFLLGQDLKWRFVDYKWTETFEIGKPQCPARHAS